MKIHMATEGTSGFGVNPVMKGRALCDGKVHQAVHYYTEVNCEKCLNKGFKALKKWLEEQWGTKIKLVRVPTRFEEKK